MQNDFQIFELGLIAVQIGLALLPCTSVVYLPINSELKVPKFISSFSFIFDERLWSWIVDSADKTFKDFSFQNIA